MTAQPYYYEPSQGHGLPHDPFNAIIGPRPIGWISSKDRQGRLNLAPHSFFNAFNYKPPIIGFSTTGWKDTARNIEMVREFGWSLVTKPLVEAMNATSAPVGPEVDEFALANLTPAPSKHIGVPRVAESPVSFECKVTQMFRLKDLNGREVDCWMVFGQVVAVYIDPSLLKDGVYQTAEAQPVVRGGGPGDYFEIRPENKFVMVRPKA
jgi:flavin reductase (DIM6/NTAB) family NADH-FMN oxidoreductase RutF